MRDHGLIGAEDVVGMGPRRHEAPSRLGGMDHPVAKSGWQEHGHREGEICRECMRALGVVVALQWEKVVDEFGLRVVSLLRVDRLSVLK